MQTLVLRDANDLMVMIWGSLNCRVFLGSNVRADVSVSRIAMGFFSNVAETVLVRAYKSSIGSQSLLAWRAEKGGSIVSSMRRHGVVAALMPYNEL